MASCAERTVVADLCDEHGGFGFEAAELGFDGT